VVLTAHRYWAISRSGRHVLREGSVDVRVHADLSRPGTETQRNVSDDLRLTWQMSPRTSSRVLELAPRKTEHWTLASTLQRTPRTSRTCRRTTSKRYFPLDAVIEAAVRSSMGNTTETWTREPVKIRKRRRLSGHRVQYRDQLPCLRRISRATTRRFGPIAVRSPTSPLPRVQDRHDAAGRSGQPMSGQQDTFPRSAPASLSV